MFVGQFSHLQMGESTEWGLVQSVVIVTIDWRIIKGKWLRSPVSKSPLISHETWINMRIYMIFSHEADGDLTWP